MRTSPASAAMRRTRLVRRRAVLMTNLRATGIHVVHILRSSRPCCRVPWRWTWTSCHWSTWTYLTFHRRASAPHDARTPVHRTALAHAHTTPTHGHPRLTHFRVAQPADTAALERLPHVQMPLDGAPLDEARLGIGEDLEMLPRSQGADDVWMSSGVKVSTLPYRILPHRTLSLTTNLDPLP